MERSALESGYTSDGSSGKSVESATSSEFESMLQFRDKSVLWWRSLEFSDAGLEYAFRSYDRVTNRKANRVILWIIAAISVPYFFIDPIETPDVSMDLLPWRAACLVVIIAALIGTYIPFLERHSGVMFALVGLLYAVFLIITVRILGLQKYVGAPVAAVMQGIGLMLTYPHRLTIVGLSSVVAYFVFDQLVFDAADLASTHSLVVACLLLLVLGVGGTAHYHMELFRRRTYLGLKVLAKDIEHLEQEEKMNAALLHNVLPKDVLDKLNEMGGSRESIVEGYDNVTCLFIDIKGITEYVGDRPANFTVETLNEIYSDFDAMLTDYAMEKIKTIGTVYMCVAGCPRPNRDHAKCAVRFALACRKVVHEFNELHEGADLQVLGGINSGSMVAGIVGKQRYVFDIWGDAVNVASRMESNGVLGEIQVSLHTRQLLDDNDFVFTDRGALDLKGKGLMRAFLVNERTAKTSGLRVPSRTKEPRVSLLSYLGGDSILSTARSVFSQSVMSGRYATLEEEEEEATMTQGVMGNVNGTEYKRSFFGTFQDPAIGDKYLRFLFDNQFGMSVFRVTIYTALAIHLIVPACDVALTLLRTPYYKADLPLLVAPMLGMAVIPLTILAYVSRWGAISSYVDEQGSKAKSTRRVRRKIRTLQALGIVLFLNLALATIGRLFCAPLLADDLGATVTIVVYCFLSGSARMRFKHAFGVGVIYLLLMLAAPNVIGPDIPFLYYEFRINAGLWFFSLVIALSTIKALENSQQKDFLLSLATEEKRAKAQQSQLASEALLLNVLPQKVATELREGSVTMAQDFRNGTLLCSDIKGFTSWSSTKEPKDLVAFLDRLFHAFDDLADELECEKIKTIGDAYVVAAGLLTEEREAARRVCLLGLRMHEAVRKVCKETGENVAMRIGVHSGPMLGGVIGTKKFSWDVWGPTVARAFKTEEDGVASRVHITAATRAHVEDFFEFDDGLSEDEADGPTYLIRCVREGTSSYVPSLSNPTTVRSSTITPSLSTT